MCFGEVDAREFRFSSTEEVLADEQIQRGVFVRQLGGPLELRDALRQLFVVDEEKTFVHQLFENFSVRRIDLPICSIGTRQDAQRNSSR